MSFDRWKKLIDDVERIRKNEPDQKGKMKDGKGKEKDQSTLCKWRGDAGNVVNSPRKAAG